MDDGDEWTSCNKNDVKMMNNDEMSLPNPKPPKKSIFFLNLIPAIQFPVNALTQFAFFYYLSFCVYAFPIIIHFWIRPDYIYYQTYFT